MKRPLARAAALLLAALIVAGGILALRPVGAGQPTYTVAQVTVALRQHPRQWANRTVLVRGTTVGFGLWGHGDLAAQGTALVDAQSVPMSPAQLMPSLFRPAPAGRPGLLLNAPGATPALLLRGAQPAAPSPLDRLARWVTTTATRLLGRARRANAYTAQGGTESRVYRVQLLTPARCPASLVTPCDTAVVR